ncbi:hypothetical protein B0H16DRAFT_935454 [Mycena metata]|uniref:Uncharacterized protein n=1 Tax=Mycena metata TaxID=1033252 RepID=A0AAD7INA8_9AGAR|nr:hypothetical protein B0H16DRAFT_935454 [Mycena metata]
MSSASATPSVLPQNRLNDYIHSAEYEPQFPECPRLRRFLLDNNDPEWLHCLETKGDARLEVDLARTQIKHFPDTPLKTHARHLQDLHSNATFKYLLSAFRVKEGNPANFTKKAANAIEIVVEAFGQLLGAAASLKFTESVSIPLIDILLHPPSTPNKRICVEKVLRAKRPTVKTIVNRRHEVNHRKAAQLARRGQENRRPAPAAKPSSSDPVSSTLFTFSA